VVAVRLESDVVAGWVRRALPHVPVAMLIVAYVLRFGQLSVAVHDGYGTPGYDMGIFDQGVWLLSRFHAPFVTVMGRDLFGDHTSFVLLLAVPLYWIWPHAQTLLVLQAVLIAAAAIPIYVLARRLTGNIALATCLAAAYLLNPALQNGNLEQFHPESFLVLFVSLAIFAAIESVGWLLALSVIASLLVKEDTALLMAPLGLWVMLRRNRRWGIWIIAGSVGYAIFATQVVIRLLLGTTSFYSGRIPFGGIWGLVTEPVLHPLRFFSYARSGYKPFYIWQMAASFGFVFLIAPEVAAIGLLTLAENVLSTFPYMQQIIYHYSLPLVPVLAMGTVFAVGRLPTLATRTVATSVVLFAALVSCTLWGLAPFSRHTYPHMSPNSAETIAVNDVLATVPADAVVSAYYPYVAHLDHRALIYQWPTPFRATYWGLYNEEGERLPFSKQIQYVVVPLDLSGVDEQVFKSISSQFTLISQGGGVGVYERTSARGP
jgi:uncharacterized membrane protein